MRIGVVGAGGRMGREVCRALAGQADLDVVAAVDPAIVDSDTDSDSGAEAAPGPGTGTEAASGPGTTGVVVSDRLEALTDAGTEVVVDFTRVEAARETLAFCAGAGIHAVVGTTGFTEEDLGELSRLFTGPPNCVVAPNFAVGAVLMMRFAELAAPWFDGAEIIELHHDGKLDAPSGTAQATAERMAAMRESSGSGAFPPDRTVTDALESARGGAGPGGVRIHSVRLPGLVAHQEVILGSLGQSLTIRHDSYDRVSFMDGVLLAVRSVTDRPGVTFGLEPLLGL